jgi:hypothetical protein
MLLYPLLRGTTFSIPRTFSITQASKKGLSRFLKDKGLALINWRITYFIFIEGVS